MFSDKRVSNSQAQTLFDTHLSCIYRGHVRITLKVCVSAFVCGPDITHVVATEICLNSHNMWTFLLYKYKKSDHIKSWTFLRLVRFRLRFG